MKYALCLAACLILLPVSAAQSRRSSYDPASQEPARQRDSFVDFALKQINPQNTDYGCQMDEARRLVVDETIKNIDSWAVLVALSCLVISFFMLLHQHRESTRREIIGAEFLAQYHNAWVDARNQAEQAIARYNQLVSRTYNAAEVAMRTPTPDGERGQTGTVRVDLSGDAKTQSTPPAPAKSNFKAGENRTDSSPTTRPPVRRNGEPEVDLIAQISTLQQQLNASHEREKKLQKELAKAPRRPPSQPQTSTNLPG